MSDLSVPGFNLMRKQNHGDWEANANASCKCYKLRSFQS